MTQDVTGLVERVLAMHMDEGGAIICHEAAATLTAQAERIAVLEARFGNLYERLRDVLNVAHDHMQKPTESVDPCIRNGVVNPVNGVNEPTLTPIDTNDDCASCASLQRDLAAAREDAERYRFWRMRVHFAMSMGRRELAFCLTKDYGPAQHEEHGRQVDAAIDAARSK